MNLKYIHGMVPPETNHLFHSKNVAMFRSCDQVASGRWHLDWKVAHLAGGTWHLDWKEAPGTW